MNASDHAAEARRLAREETSDGDAAIVHAVLAVHITLNDLLSEQRAIRQAITGGVS